MVHTLNADQVETLRNFISGRISQKALSMGSGLPDPDAKRGSEAWLSKALKTSGERLDGELLKRFLQDVLSVAEAEAESQGSRNVRLVIKNLLEEIDAGKSTRLLRIYEPGETLLADAADYQERIGLEDRLRRMTSRTGELQIRWRVRGGCMVGKSSFLRRAMQVTESRYGYRPTVLNFGAQYRTRSFSELCAKVIVTVGGEWGYAYGDEHQVAKGILRQHGGGELYVEDFVRWFSHNARVGSKLDKRLLVLDGLENLEPRAFALLLESLRETFNRESVGGLWQQVGWILCGTECDPADKDNWTRVSELECGRQFRVEWFDPGVVRRMAEENGLGRYVDMIYEQFGGQPYLTHAALAGCDEALVEAIAEGDSESVRDWSPLGRFAARIHRISRSSPSDDILLKIADTPRMSPFLLGALRDQLSEMDL